MRPSLPLAAALSLALSLALTWLPRARADAHADPETPSDAILTTESDLAMLPANPADYMSASVGNVTWDFPRQAESEARELMAAWRPAWDGIESDLGEALDSTMRIRIARNATEMRSLAPVGLPPPEYAAGVAYPALGLVLLTFTAPDGVEPPDIQKVMVHELSHVALHRAVGGHPVPRWFTEGLAIHQAGERSFERAKVLMRATYDSERIPLRELSDRFPSRAYEVDLAYAESADIVRFLLSDPRGAAKLRRLVRGLRDGASFADALEDAYYMRPAQLEREWIADLSSRNRMFPVLVGGGIAWALAALLLPLAYLRRRRRARAKLADMARRENEERAERLQELLESLRAKQSLLVVSAGELTAAPLVSALRPGEPSGTDDTGQRGNHLERSPATRVIRAEGAVPVVKIGEETHTLH